MEIDFQAKMAAKDTEQLLAIIENRKKYVPDAINAAVNELKSRGHIFSQEELEHINSDIEKKVRIENNIDDNYQEYDNEMSIFPREPKPVYYSKQAIIGFSVFFSVLFGAILMAINVRKNKQHILMTIVLGILFTAMIYYIQDLLGGKRSLSILFNGLGGLVIAGGLWPKFIGNKTQYIKREIWIPLIIGIIILFIFLYTVYNFRVSYN